MSDPKLDIDFRNLPVPVARASRRFCGEPVLNVSKKGRHIRKTLKNTSFKSYTSNNLKQTVMFD